MLNNCPNRNKKKKFVTTLLNWEKKFGRDFSWRQNRSPYNVFITEFLLKRTTSTAAQKFYIQFLDRYPTLFEIKRSNIHDLEQFLQPIGLQKQRSRGIKEAAEFIIKNYGGELPNTFDELIKIPHVGNYSAACILSFGMGIPAPAIDSNGVRVISNVFKNQLDPSISIKTILQFSWDLISPRDHTLFNYGLIDMGALLCSYRGCSKEKCPMRIICDTYQTQKKQKNES